MLQGYGTNIEGLGMRGIGVYDMKFPRINKNYVIKKKVLTCNPFLAQEESLPGTLYDDSFLSILR